MRLASEDTMFRTAIRVVLAALCAAAIGVVLIPAAAEALAVTGAELVDGRLRVDGVNAAPGVFVTVESTTSAAGVRSDGVGAYHVEAGDFRADDCTVVVSDRRTRTETVALDGCIPTPVDPPTTTPPPTGGGVITPGAPASVPAGALSPYYPHTTARGTTPGAGRWGLVAGPVHAGDLSTYYLHPTGCDTTAGPVRWAFVAGRVPVGMTGPFTQGRDAGAVSGRPTVEGFYSFEVRVTDSAGATDTETFDITVLGPRPVTVTTDLPAGAVGQSYSESCARRSTCWAS